MSSQPTGGEGGPGLRRQSVNRIKSWLEPEPEKADIDVEHVLILDYRHIETDVDDGRVRCDLCGSLFDAVEMPECIEHVAAHDDQGAAEVDPVDESSPGEPIWGVADEDWRETTDQPGGEASADDESAES